MSVMETERGRIYIGDPVVGPTDVPDGPMRLHAVPEGPRHPTELGSPAWLAEIERQTEAVRQSTQRVREFGAGAGVAEAVALGLKWAQETRYLMPRPRSRGISGVLSRWLRRLSGLR